MDVALHCAHCGSPSSGTRFCTSCGTDLAAAPSVPAPRPAYEQGTEQVGAPAPAPAETPAPWLPDAPVPTGPPRRLDALLGLAVVALLVSGGWLLWGFERHTISGTVVLDAASYSRTTPGTRCTGIGSSARARAGASAVLRDARGDTVTTARLSEGVTDGTACVFTFTFEDVPRADEYDVGVEDVDSETFTYDDLSSHHWSVELSRG